MTPATAQHFRRTSSPSGVATGSPRHSRQPGSTPRRSPRWSRSPTTAVRAAASASCSTSLPPATSGAASGRFCPSPLRSETPSSTAFPLASSRATPSATCSSPPWRPPPVTSCPGWRRPAACSEPWVVCCRRRREPVVLKAQTAHGEIIGQARLTRSEEIATVSLVPPDAVPPSGVIEAIGEADQIVLGPGSLFTSVLAACVVPEIRESLRCDAGPTRLCREPARAAARDARASTSRGSLRSLREHEVPVDVVMADGAALPLGAVPDDVATRRGERGRRRTSRARPEACSAPSFAALSSADRRFAELVAGEGECFVSRESARESDCMRGDRLERSYRHQRLWADREEFPEIRSSSSRRSGPVRIRASRSSPSTISSRSRRTCTFFVTTRLSAALAPR